MSLRWALALSLVWLACGPSPVRGARELGEIASRRFREWSVVYQGVQARLQQAKDQYQKNAAAKDKKVHRAGF